jgi:hypothetical protein
MKNKPQRGGHSGGPIKRDESRGLIWAGVAAAWITVGVICAMMLGVGLSEQNEQTMEVRK